MGGGGRGPEKGPREDQGATEGGQVTMDATPNKKKGFNKTEA